MAQSAESREWYCGCHACFEETVVVTGEEGVMRHLREEHPDLVGAIFLPVEG